MAEVKDLQGEQPIEIFGEGVNLVAIYVAAAVGSEESFIVSWLTDERAIHSS